MNLTYCILHLLINIILVYTENLEDRIFRHTNSGSKSTKKANDCITKYTEEFNSRSDAVRRELEIKRKKSKKHIEWLISSLG